MYLPGGGFSSAIKFLGENRRRYVADALADAKAAIRFLRVHASEYHLDPSHLGVWGESAGGYLAAMVGVTNGMARFEPSGTGPSTRVQAVVDVFGLSDLTKIGADYDAANQAAHRSPSITEATFVNGKDSGRTILDDLAEARRANPISYVDAHDPPFLLLHGSRDGLVSPSQTARLRRALAANGVPVTRYVVEGAGHAGPEWSTAPIMRLIVAFLAAKLH